MLMIEEDLRGILPNSKSGKIVGIASYRGEYILVACEYGLYRVWDDGTHLMASRAPDTSGERNA